MYEKKYAITLDSFDKDLLVNGMNEFRNMLLDDGLPTEEVEKLIIRIIDTPPRRERFARNDAR